MLVCLLHEASCDIKFSFSVACIEVDEVTKT